MKTEVCSVWGPHSAFSSFWACQTSQLPYSQWQQTPSLFLPPNINLLLYPPSELRAVFQKQSPKQKQPPMTTQKKSQLSFCWISFHVVKMFQTYLQPQETVTSSCLMKWQNNRFAYAKTGVVTGLTTLDLKHVTEVYLQQQSQRYWCSDGQSKLHHL